jgi:hypothetical protein
MTAFLLKWGIASLVMPALVLMFDRVLNDVLVLVFWPGSIALMSLGAEKRPLGDVIYVWGAAIGLNIVLYLVVGLLVYTGMKLVRG